MSGARRPRTRIDTLRRVARSPAHSSSAGPVRLAAVAAAPGYYHVPLYRLLAADPRIDLTVLYASSEGVRPHDQPLGAGVVWDVDQLSGYRYRFLQRSETNRFQEGFLSLHDWDVVRAMRSGGYDALWVHGYSYLTLWLAMAAARISAIPILVREEQTLLHSRPWPKRWLRAALLRGLFSQVWGLYVSSNNRAYFRRYGLPEERLFFTPYCVDNDYFQARAQELAPRRAELRARFGIPENAGPVVLFVGKLIPKKSPERLVEAFRRVRREIGCALLLVGDGHLAERLAAFVERARVPDVHFAGFLNRSEISDAYAAADVFVLPSARHETFGLVVNEAMNFSLPVVVSDKVGCAPDLVREGDNGYVVPYDDVGALADALERLIRDGRLRQRMGATSREIVSGWHYGVAAEGVVRASLAATGRPAAAAA